MKIKSSLKKRCELCKYIKRKKILFIICLHKKHNQKQG